MFTIFIILVLKSNFMKHTTLLSLVILMLPVLVFGQYGQGDNHRGGGWDNDASSLSIFSENGEQFFVVLNGVNQNNMPTSQIRIEGLPKYGNDVEILFADNRTQAIRKNVNIADPVDGKAVNMVLKISRNREGYPRLKFHKCTEVERGYRAQRGEYMMMYGRPEQIQTTTETYYNDPVVGQTVTQTTTTQYNNNDRRQPVPVAVPVPVAMSDEMFAETKKAIRDASFDDTKLSTAKTIIGTNFVTTAQVMELSKQFSFDDAKLKFVKFAYNNCVDKNNYFKLGSIFSWDSDKEALNNFISGKH